MTTLNSTLFALCCFMSVGTWDRSVDVTESNDSFEVSSPQRFFARKEGTRSTITVAGEAGVGRERGRFSWASA